MWATSEFPAQVEIITKVGLLLTEQENESIMFSPNTFSPLFGKGQGNLTDNRKLVVDVDFADHGNGGDSFQSRDR